MLRSRNLRSMAPIALAALSVLSNTDQAVAQRGPLYVAPGLSADGIDPTIDFSTNPLLAALTGISRPIYACNATKLPSDPPGTFTLSFTIRGLRGFGNPGFSGFLLAHYDPNATEPLTLLHDADAVNGPFVDYNLTIEPTTVESGQPAGGRYAVFDRFSTPQTGLQYLGVHLASRPDDTLPFGAPVPVAGIVAANGFADPALGHVDGQLKLFYAGTATNSAGVSVDGILMDDLLGADTATPRVAGNPVLVSQAVEKAYCHSPSVVVGAAGDVEGLFVAEGNSTFDRSDVFFAADLDPDTPQVKTVETASWLSSGGSAGGFALFTQRDTPNAPRRIEGTWLVGDEVPPGSTAQLTMYAYTGPGTGPTVASVYLSPVWLPHPVRIPGVHGALGVAPAIRLGPAAVDADGRAVFTVPTPRLPVLRGRSVPIQGLACGGPNGSIRTLSNTATFRFR